MIASAYTYTSDRTSLALGGAWLLWIVGVTLVYAVLRPPVLTA